MPDARKARPAGSLFAPNPASVAFWALLGLSVTSISIRPVVAFLQAPQALLNIDALLTPVAAGLVFLAALTSWKRIGFAQRFLTLCIGLLVLAVLISWLVATPRSWASLALGASVLLLLPLALYVAVMAIGRRPGTTDRLALAVMVLSQLAVGLLQYVLLEVAQKAPKGADLVDGTTSHNFWPVFALPASLVLALSSRDRLRLLWPFSVTLLGIYSEAKAALVVWLPVIIVLLAWDAWRRRSGDRSHRIRKPAPVSLDAGLRRGLVGTTLAIVVIGMWWTPSVQSTWSVFLGHSRTFEEFATTGDAGDATQPTLSTAATLISRHMTSSPTAFLFGLGPANSASHSAEVLAQGAKSGVSLPQPGPIAQQLLAEQDVIRFRDSQSTLLGIWGDLGSVGAALYLLFCAGAVIALVRLGSGYRLLTPRALAHPAVVVGLLAGGALLDWPEQSSVVLPLALSILVLAKHSPDDTERVADDTDLADANQVPVDQAEEVGS